MLLLECHIEGLPLGFQARFADKIDWRGGQTLEIRDRISRNYFFPNYIIKRERSQAILRTQDVILQLLKDDIYEAPKEVNWGRKQQICDLKLLRNITAPTKTSKLPSINVKLWEKMYI